MRLLGEQLITDEIAAISELVKNSWDADAKSVIVTLFNVSEPDGYIQIKDNGHGMTRETVLSSWLELGTLSKTRTPGEKRRKSESGKRPYLGEKGLGRLAINKLGELTELVTRRTNENLETKVVLDWTKFETGGLLNDIPVLWEQRAPEVFVDRPSNAKAEEEGEAFPNGTQITINKLQRQWTQSMIMRIRLSLWAMKSPFAGLTGFNIEVQVHDKLDSDFREENLKDLVSFSTYSFVGEISSNGKINYQYKFSRPDLIEIARHVTQVALPDPEYFKTRKPTCGSFKLRFYAWDLDRRDLRDVFGDTAIYDESIKPNTGVKLFRDGFRVLPYVGEDNDWLSMDMGRIRQFEMNLSRNQVIGVIEISSQTNPKLIDKTDREGLIDNDAFRDFRAVVKTALVQFEAERYQDRRKLKQKTGRTAGAQKTKSIYTKTLAVMSRMIESEPRLRAELRHDFKNLLSELRHSLDSMMAEQEDPLLVAATIGLTYMMPTHEVRREIHEALRVLRKIRESQSLIPDQGERLAQTVTLLRQADSTVGGIGRLMQRDPEGEPVNLHQVAKDAIELMRYRFERNNILCDMEIRKTVVATGSERLITIIMLNFFDNSIYWLMAKKPEERRIKVIIDAYDSGSILVVSDSGSGFQDDIETVTLPFMTRKPTGMGLGLYIADRVARRFGAKLKILSRGEIPGLLAGANIAVIFPKPSA
jgi:signal transduction histidine kinase